MDKIRLTAYSHGAGCGCKISPSVLKSIIGNSAVSADLNLLVGNNTSDDAAVYDIGDGKAIISTTDFFMPIVDDPFDFGAIASANALSDVYAMGGKPLMAIAILGWPVNKLSPEIASKVLDGSRNICSKAGITLAGGHSIDSPEPIFGLAATGIVNSKDLKRNSSAKAGSALFLTKPLGIGIVTTAEKKGIALENHLQIAKESMMALNSLGSYLSSKNYVNAMTDVTGFGLLGHLIEMCEGSDLSAEIDYNLIPKFEFIEDYLDKGAIPGGTTRNWESYGHKVEKISSKEQTVLADPQTSGGLLISVEESSTIEFIEDAKSQGISIQPFGALLNPKEKRVYLK